MLSGLVYPTSGDARVPIGLAISVPVEAMTSQLAWTTVASAYGFAVVLFAFTGCSGASACAGISAPLPERVVRYVAGMFERAHQALMTALLPGPVGAR